MTASKSAYPNYSDITPFYPVADLRKWTEAFKNIYVKVHLGASKTAATQEVIHDWPTLEQFNFKNWLKYYESGDQFKYKTAQYYVNDQTAYFLPNPPAKSETLTPPSPLKSVQDIQEEAKSIAEATKPGLNPDDQRKLIEDHRRKLISRLNSVEKLLGSQHGHLFAGKDFEKLLGAIYELKKQIQTINKVSLSSQTYVDLIIRQANILQRQNCSMAAGFLKKFAQQVPGNGQAQYGDMPLSGSAPQGLGSLENATPPLKDIATKPPIKQAPLDGIDGFLDNLEGVGLTDGNELQPELKDELEADDQVILDDDDVILDQEVGPKGELRVEAQMLGPQGEVDPLATKPKVELLNSEPKEKTELGPADKKDDAIPTRNIDDIIESAFSQITPRDYLHKLQEISAIFQKKEILRQLSIADLMGQKLGLSSYFTEYSELQQKMLDATNYINTRLNNIISTLEGSIGKSTIDLNPDNSSNNPETMRLQNYLSNQQKKDKEQKQLRKDVENQQLQEKLDKPPLEIESPAGELAAETPALTPAPAPKPTPAAFPAV